MRRERLSTERILLAKMWKDVSVRAKYLMSIKPSDFISENNRVVLNVFQKLGDRLTRKVFVRELRKLNLGKRLYGSALNSFRKIIATNTNDMPEEYVYEEFKKNIIVDERVNMMLRYTGLIQKGELKEAEKIFRDHYYRSDLSNDEFLVDEGEITDDLKDRVRATKLRKKYPEKYRGIRTGITRIDKRTDGLYRGEFGLLFGLVSIGKSMVALNFVHYARMMGHNVLVICNEMPKSQVQFRYDSLLTGIPYNKFKRGEISYSEMDVWKEYYKEEEQSFGKLYIISIGANCTTDFIDRKLGEYDAKGIKIDLLIIDSISYTESTKKSWSEQHSIGLAAKDIKDMALRRNLPIWGLAQATVDSEEDEKYTMKNVGYSRRQIHIADIAIAVLKREADKEEDTLTLQIVKNREDEKDVFVRVRPEWEIKKIRELK